MEPTAEQIEAFKAAWHKADAGGEVGSRVENGLRAVLQDLTDPEVTVRLPRDWQGIVLWIGDGPLILGDGEVVDGVTDYFGTALSRRMAVARLRYWAEAIEQGDI